LFGKKRVRRCAQKGLNDQRRNGREKALNEVELGGENLGGKVGELGGVF